MFALPGRRRLRLTGGALVGEEKEAVDFDAYQQHIRDLGALGTLPMACVCKSQAGELIDDDERANERADRRSRRLGHMFLRTFTSPWR